MKSPFPDLIRVRVIWTPADGKHSGCLVWGWNQIATAKLPSLWNIERNCLCTPPEVHSAGKMLSIGSHKHSQVNWRFKTAFQQFNTKYHEIKLLKSVTKKYICRLKVTCWSSITRVLFYSCKRVSTGHNDGFTIVWCFFAFRTRCWKSPTYRPKVWVTPPVSLRNTLAETPGQHEGQHYPHYWTARNDTT